MSSVFGTLSVCCLIGQAFLVVLGGLSSLQSRANDLTLLPAQRALYVETYQSGGQVLLCPQSCVPSRHWQPVCPLLWLRHACVAFCRTLQCLLGRSAFGVQLGHVHTYLPPLWLQVQFSVAEC